MLNTNLTIHPQAYAVLHMLVAWNENFIEMRGLDRLDTFAWYNGRERGIAVVAEHVGRDERFVVVFGELRNSDGIFVDVYEGQGSFLDPPHWTDDGYEQAYEKRESFPHGAAGKAAVYVLKHISKWIKEKNAQAA